LRYYSVFCLDITFKSIQIYSETQVLVAPLKIRELQKCSSLFLCSFTLKTPTDATDCVNQRVNRVNHSKRSLLQVESAE